MPASTAVRGNVCLAGAIWAGAMMLDHAGFPDAGGRVLAALEETLASGTKTRDLGGQRLRRR
jgi:isocitrate/isopropylmalate dehydrogenase